MRFRSFVASGMTFVSTCLSMACLPAQDASQTTQYQFVIPDTDDGLAGAGPIRRYPWMRQKWNRRRTEFAKQAPEQNGSIVFFGDSITEGWRNDFRGEWKAITDAGFQLANRGIGGDTTRGMLLRFEEDVLQLNPIGLVMLMGTNDLEEKATAPQIAGNVGLMLEQLHAKAPECPVILCLVMPSSETKKRPSDRITEINEALQDVVRGNDQVTLVDTWTLFADEQGNAKAAEFPDLLHPNNAGYAKWARALKPIFATLGWVDQKPEPLDIGSGDSEPGFTRLFNGTDLSGWQYRPTPQPMRKGRDRWLSSDPKGVSWPLVEHTLSFDKQTATPDGRYIAQAGRLVVTAASEGRVIQQLWTQQDFSDDFTLRLEFRAAVNADSGLFLRGKQLQCRDYALAGPYKTLKNYRPQQWNTLEVVVKDDVAVCSCNGEVVEAAFELPPSGPIGLEGDQGQIEYRRIRIRQH